MERTQGRIQAMIERLEELCGNLNELQATFESLATTGGFLDDGFRLDTTERLASVEDRLDHLAAKWLEHDQAIYRMRRRESPTLPPIPVAER